MAKKVTPPNKPKPVKSGPSSFRPLFLPPSLPAGYTSWENWYSQNPIPQTLPINSSTKSDTTDIVNIFHRQLGKESGMFNPDIISGKRRSSKGALGMAQAMPSAIKDYEKSIGRHVDVTNPKEAIGFQKYEMNRLISRPWASNPKNESDSVAIAKALAAYNYGATNTVNALNKAKAKGIDIYSNKMEWLKELPLETSDYVNKILLKKNAQFEEDYNKVKDLYKEYYKQGGLIKKANGGWLDSYEDGSEVTSNPLMNIPESQRFPKQPKRTVVYPQGYIENRVNPNAPRIPLNFMGQPFATGAIEESISPLDLIGGVRGGANLVKGAVKYSKAAKKYKDLMQPNYVDFYGDLIDIGASPRAVRRTANQMSEAGRQMHKGVRDIVLPNTFEYGGSIEDQRIPTPTKPSSYPDYTNPTLTNYQMGTPKSNLPIRGLRDATPEIPAYGYGGMINKYAAGATVWTKQDTPTWAAGTPTPTATQNFKNTNSINTSRYRIGDVIPTGMDYKTPAAGTKDYSRVMTSYDWNNQRRLHAPDTTIMRDGGDIKKNVPGLRYHILNSYANGGIVSSNKYKQGGWLDNL